MEQRLVKIGAAAEVLGTKPDTLRKWERTRRTLAHAKDALTDDEKKETAKRLSIL